MQTIVINPKPVIAEVAGIATAAGCQLVASCDLAYASKSAQFATPGVNIGLFCSTPMVPISRTIGPKKTMEMLLTGDSINAKTALSIGLINEVTTNVKLSSITQIMAQKIASKSKNILELGKKGFYEQIKLPTALAYEHTSKIMSKNMMMEDAKKGIDAFISKTQHTWNKD